MPSQPNTFKVESLFDQYDHDLAFDTRDHLAIIYGPNGVGKTKFLETIYSLLQGNWSSLSRIQFRFARITFDDGSVLSAQSSGRESERVLHINLRGRRGERRNVEWEFRSSRHWGRYLGPTWVESGDGSWIDTRDGELLTDTELRRRYNFDLDLDIDSIPEPLTEFLSQHACYLIGIQRLINARLGDRAEMASSSNTVSQYSDDIRKRLAVALTENSKKTQALDRTFPRRLLDASIPRVTESEIREAYARQNRKREELARIGLIGGEPDFPLPTQKRFENWQRIVLGTYLDDTEEKLATFDDVLARVNLLESIINKRYLRKSFSVSATDGLQIRSDVNGGRIQPNSLSSGEQHELVMFYDLLFRVPAGALVLIDEPEISLHVAWQREFLDDLFRVLEVSDLRVIVATHSPQVIGKWRGYTTQLGPQFTEDLD